MTDATRKALEMAREALEYHNQQTRPIARTEKAIAAITEALAEPAPEPAMAFCPACFVEVSKDQCDSIARDAKLYREQPAPRRLSAADVNEIWLGCRSIGDYAHRHEFASAIIARIFGDKE